MTFDEIKSVLGTKSVGIAGCGGLGSNCAIALARVGIGSLVIADFDVIVESNLNRQYYFHDQIGMLKVFALKRNIEMVNPRVRVHAFDIRLCMSDTIEIFSRCDVIVEAFDKAEMKHMIIDAVHTHLPDKHLVMGVGMAGWGENELIHCRKSDKLIICGDELNEIAEHNPPLAPRVGIVASMQANAVLEILLGPNTYRMKN
ncbi:MAG: sulfur carrier protein ThiS adenylyltransferase ThiF [Bacteroidales bacterium]|nr:sulfur carrier protein ThiS adenylyltransferase ThiF [Bacteroidales bacterium]MBK7172901.1 sulfur carrier protein ThiS adenylyltransferase ThiF [Bacteroidales bacterium]